MANKKAVALISGGLDSILAARIVMDQGFDVIGLYCTSVFSKSFGNENTTPAASVARAIGMELRITDLGQQYIDLIRNPKHGYGKHINPCIDCKIFMLGKAKSLMRDTGADFVITGEVLGQRPMSQRRDTLNVIERDSGLRGRILRPLSAILLPPTEAEAQGVVNRSRLCGISGRGRSVQLQLAGRFGISGFSTPAGGCLLTDKNFEAKLRDLFFSQSMVTAPDIALLTIGRHFKLPQGAKIVVGRDSEENDTLARIAQQGFHLFSPHDFPGPAAVLTAEPSQETKEIVGKLILFYSKKRTAGARLIRIETDLFDPGEPLPPAALGLKKIGTEH